MSDEWAKNLKSAAQATPDKLVEYILENQAAPTPSSEPVERYALCADRSGDISLMRPRSDGEYVRFTDYTALQSRLAEVEGELEALKSGESAILPQSHKHAQDLYTVAVACLKSYGEDPEARTLGDSNE